MSDEQLRDLEREARGKKDPATNEALKRAQERAGLPPIGITTIRDREDAYILEDLSHNGAFCTVAWSKNRIPSQGLATADELQSQLKGGYIERALGLFRKRQQWELPDTKLIYSTIVAVNALVRHESTAALAAQLMEHLGNNILGAIAHFITGTTIHYQSGEQDTLVHRDKTASPQTFTLPLKDPTHTIRLDRAGEREQSILLALLGTSNVRDIQDQLVRFSGVIRQPHITMSTATPQDAPRTIPLGISFNRRSSHGEIALSLLAQPLPGDLGRRPGHTIPVQYL